MNPPFFPTTLNPSPFSLESPWEPQGDQPQAIEKLVSEIQKGTKHQILLGVTGSGKTFTLAHTIARTGLSTLILAPNKTLAAQLYTEFKSFFPKDPVGYFVSYYDYFRPEAYIPSTDTYIAKDSAINETIDKMRHEATRQLFECPGSIVVSSVSCIYGLGSPQAYAKLAIHFSVGDKLHRDDLLRSLVAIQYERSDFEFKRGAFRVRGDCIDVLPSHATEEAIRFILWDDKLENLEIIDALTGQTLREVTKISIYPNSHYVADRTDWKTIVEEIQRDLFLRLEELKALKDLPAYYRLEARTMKDLEALETRGFCPGIENYSRYITGKSSGEPPDCLMDYFPENFLVIIDESHVTLPQIGAMYKGDRSRKENLVHYGFRLPSALDNRPLTFQEFEKRSGQVIYVSATPGSYELSKGKIVVEQIIRPTGLVDPQIEVHPTQFQIDHLHEEILKTIEKGGRILVTTLTKKMAEELSSYFMDLNFKVGYIHADVDTLERTSILRKLRQGILDVLVGINLLREGIDLPEVQLVAIMDADKEGFLRSRSSLIQMIGRAARNAEGRVIFYADRITQAMKEAMNETQRRRALQESYNREYGIIPKSIAKSVPEELTVISGLEDLEEDLDKDKSLYKTPENLEKIIKKKRLEMKKLAEKMDFEQASRLRDELKRLTALLMVWQTTTEP